MCFAAKIKTPSVDTNQIRAIDPAPLTEEPKGVLFGGDDDDTKGVSTETTTGRKSLKVAKDTSVSKSAPATSTGTKSAIRKAFNIK